MTRIKSAARRNTPSATEQPTNSEALIPVKNANVSANAAPAEPGGQTVPGSEPRQERNRMDHMPPPASAAANTNRPVRPPQEPLRRTVEGQPKRQRATEQPIIAVSRAAATPDQVKSDPLQTGSRREPYPQQTRSLLNGEQDHRQPEPPSLLTTLTSNSAGHILGSAPERHVQDTQASPWPLLYDEPARRGAYQNEQIAPSHPLRVTTRSDTDDAARPVQNPVPPPIIQTDALSTLGTAGEKPYSGDNDPWPELPPEPYTTDSESDTRYGEWEHRQHLEREQRGAE